MNWGSDDRRCWWLCNKRVVRLTCASKFSFWERTMVVYMLSMSLVNTYNSRSVRAPSWKLSTTFPFLSFIVIFWRSPTWYQEPRAYSSVPESRRHIFLWILRCRELDAKNTKMSRQASDKSYYNNTTYRRWGPQDFFSWSYDVNQQATHHLARHYVCGRLQGYCTA